MPNQSLLPATIKQLLDAKQTADDDTFRVDGRELSDITVIGVIRHVAEHATSVIYTIEDGSGKIDLRQWLDTAGVGGTASFDANASARRAQLREGIYVRAVGTLRSFQDHRSVSINFIRPIEDFNEITFHFLECVHSHLQSTRQQQTPFATPKLAWGAMGSDSFGTPSKSFGNSTAGIPASYVRGGAPIASSVATNGEYTPLQSRIMATIRANHGNEGTRVNQVVQELREFANEAQIRAAVDWLSSEGHLYSTLDDEHYKVTDA